MSGTVPWISAQADNFEGEAGKLDSFAVRKREKRPLASKAPQFPTSGLVAHQFPAKASPLSLQGVEGEGETEAEQCVNEVEAEDVAVGEVQTDADRREEERRAQELLRQQELDRAAELRPYRGRTTSMLRRYLRYSLETGRLPSILGSEFFRTRVTSYRVVTFEDRVIFVHDMEICLEKLDEFSRQIIARYVLQGHDLRETARLTNATVRTTRRNIPAALDELSEILLKMGLMEDLFSNRKKSCQEGKSGEFPASSCEQKK